MMHSSIPQLLRVQALSSPETVAIVAPGRRPLTYGALYKQVQSAGAQLNRWGIGRDDRVVIVLENGPEMAVGFLSVAATAIAAPLNPAYTEQEFEFFVTDLEAKAVVVEAGRESPVRQVARRHGMAVIELHRVAERPAGLFELSGTSLDGMDVQADRSRAVEPDNVALVLHTSGTTSRPKLVPLTHRNLCLSARNVARSLELVRSDRCLNIMPLFHIHGLVAATLSSLASGSSVALPPPFRIPTVLEWLEALRPTWYTAVPTMHQAILSSHSATSHRLELSLRFIRSSSAALAPSLLDQMEKRFQVPVIEAYGMTEAAHQMTSNPLPPRRRKPGSVGIAAGPEIAIMDEKENRTLEAGQTGEIVVRGENVTPGYAGPKDANAKAFSADGWFRTGDEGYLDEDGYLFIRGRLKEIINRGGEKISPREIEEVLLAHPAVREAVTFAVPHTSLGETVASAVVPVEGERVSEESLRQHLAERLAYFKIPVRVLLLEELPKGATGKVQRRNLAAQLGLETWQGTPDTGSRDASSPADSRMKGVLIELWRDVLGIEKVGLTDSFLQLGGDSISAMRLVGRLQQRLGLQISLADFLQAPTVLEQVRILEKLRDQSAP